MPSSGPKVSVIVPVFNGARSIEGSLNSLFKQELQEIEVIVVDDASNDNTADILQTIAAVEPRLRVITQSQNGGVHEARSAGLEAIRAPWVGFLDADDFAKPSMFRLLYEAGTEHAADIVICGMDCITPHGDFLNPKVSFARPETHTQNLLGRFCGLQFGTGSLCNKLYRTELISHYGQVTFRWRQDASEDALVNIGCFLAADRVRVVEHQLYSYVNNPKSASQSISNAQALCRHLRAYAVALDTYEAEGPGVLSQITKLYLKQLSYDCYQIESLSEIEDYLPELSQAFCLTVEKYPLGLAALATRSTVVRRDELGAKQAIKTWCGLSLKIPNYIASALKRRLVMHKD